MRVRAAWLVGCVAAATVLVACEPRPANGPPPAADEPDPTQPARTQVTVYFTRDEEPVPVTRDVPRGPAVLRAALDALVAGPTPDEREAGISSWFSDETASAVIDVQLDDGGLATVDFKDISGVITGASSSAGSRILLNELNATVFQFDQVEAVRYRFAGDCDAFWNWLQRGCTAVTRADHPID